MCSTEAADAFTREEDACMDGEVGGNKRDER